jgi:hypothetical protein
LFKSFSIIQRDSMKTKAEFSMPWSYRKDQVCPVKTKNIWFGKYCTRKGSKYLSRDIYSPSGLLSYFMGWLHFLVKAIQNILKHFIRNTVQAYCT